MCSSDLNTLTCTGRDGKAMMSMKIKCEENGMISATEIVGLDQAGTTDKTSAKKGMVICTSDYCAICIHDDPKEASGSATGTAESQLKSKCTVILKREGAGTETRRDK